MRERERNEFVAPWVKYSLTESGGGWKTQVRERGRRVKGARGAGPGGGGEREKRGIRERGGGGEK